MSCPRCKAKCKATQQQCKRLASIGKTVCRMHGGAKGSGGLHGLKSGRYAKSLLHSTLSAAYASAVNDKELLDLKEPIALLEACLQRTGERVAQADTPEYRRRALELYQASMDANAEGNHTHAGEMLRELGKLLRDGVSEDRAISELSVQAERLSKRIEGAWNVKLQRKQVLTIQQFGILMARILEIVRHEAPLPVAVQICSRVEGEVMRLPERAPDGVLGR